MSFKFYLAPSEERREPRELKLIHRTCQDYTSGGSSLGRVSVHKLVFFTHELEEDYAPRFTSLQLVSMRSVSAGGALRVKRFI